MVILIFSFYHSGNAVLYQLYMPYLPSFIASIWNISNIFIFTWRKGKKSKKISLRKRNDEINFQKKEMNEKIFTRIQIPKSLVIGREGNNIPKRHKIRSSSIDNPSCFSINQIFVREMELANHHQPKNKDGKWNPRDDEIWHCKVTTEYTQTKNILDPKCYYKKLLKLGKGNHHKKKKQTQILPPPIKD